MHISLSEHFNYRKLLRFTFPSIIMMIFTSVYGVYPEEGEGPGLLSSGHRVMLVPIDKELGNLPVSVYLLK